MIRRLLLSLAGVAVASSVAACQLFPGSGPTPVPSVTVPVTGLVHAGPTCPVSKPNDSVCADRPVSGAVLVVTDAAGTEVTRATSAADGTFTLNLAAGTYRLVPQPVAGVLGTAQPQSFQVPTSGAAAPLDVAYDTGIR